MLIAESNVEVGHVPLLPSTKHSYFKLLAHSNSQFLILNRRRSRDRSRERGRRSPGRDRGWGRDREPVQNLPPIAIRKETGSAFQESRRRKIFIGGLHIEATVTDIERYFGRFGRLIDSVVMFDHDTRRSRGFGFITYDNDESVQQVLNPSVIHKIMDRPVEVKLAVPKGEETLPPWKSEL